MVCCEHRQVYGKGTPCCGALLYSVCGGVGQVGLIRSQKKKKRRARLIGSLDMAQPKDVHDFRTFSHPHDHDDKKKSAKGGREAFKREGGAKKLI